MKKHVIIYSIIAATFLGSVAVALLRHSPGIAVTIVNRGPEPLFAVVIHVTGNAHVVGNLVAGESRTVTVQPRSESHIELEFADSSGKQTRLDAGGYFEPGYKGTVRVELKDGAIERNDHRISLGY